MISFRVKGDFSKTERFFRRVKGREYLKDLDKYGIEGVAALALATPYRTGKTASSWDYEIEQGDGVTSIIFTNDNVNKNVNIAIILEYGHGTRNGGYVAGRHYIEPAIQPLFDKLADDAWREVTRE